MVVESEDDASELFEGLGVIEVVLEIKSDIAFVQGVIQGLRVIGKI